MVPVEKDGQKVNRDEIIDEFDRDEIIDEFEEELKKARRWARIVGISHGVSQFLVFCNLTWATVALLGAFLPSLGSRDFAFITSLLFIEAGRLASSSIFLRFLMCPLVYGSQDPKRLKHGEDARNPASLYLRFASYIIQFLLVVPSIVISIIGHVRLRSYSILNLNSSLRIFYSFVALNSLVGLFNLICSVLAFRALNNLPPEQSILRYFDTVLEKGIRSGLVEADVFEFFSFAYTMLGGEYRRNVQPEGVAKNHKRLIQYLYAHRLGQDALKTYLEAGDPYVQLAAVNLVGFWADRKWGVGVPEKERKLSEDLLTKLADKVGTGQLGWAASTSFGVLAGTPKGARIMEGIRTSSNIRLPDQLVNLVDASSSRSLSPVRTLMTFYEQYSVKEQQPPRLFEQEEKLVAKLEKLATEAKVHRLRVVAAYLLLLMGKPADRNVIVAIDPRVDDYWFTSEVQMLRLLNSHILDPPEIPPFRKPDPVPDRKKSAPKMSKKTKKARKRNENPIEREDEDITAPSWAEPEPSISA